MSLQKAVRRARDQRAVDLAGCDHVAQGLVADAGELHIFGQAELDLLDAPGLVGAGLVPMHVLERHSVLVVEPATHVDGGGVRPFRRADGLALEVGRGFDPAVFVDVERREAEQPRAHHRQADDVGLIARHLGAEFRERQLAHLPFAVEGEAREHLVVTQREPGVIDALGIDQAKPEIPEMIVVGGGDGELETRHCFFPPEPLPARTPCRQVAWGWHPRETLGIMAFSSLQSAAVLPTLGGRGWGDCPASREATRPGGIGRCVTPMTCWGCRRPPARRTSRAHSGGKPRSCTRTPTSTTPRRPRASPSSMPPMRSWARRASARPSTAARSTPKASRASRASRASAAADLVAFPATAISRPSASAVTASSGPPAVVAAAFVASAASRIS